MGRLKERAEAPEGQHPVHRALTKHKRAIEADRLKPKIIGLSLQEETAVFMFLALQHNPGEFLVTAQKQLEPIMEFGQERPEVLKKIPALAERFDPILDIPMLYLALLQSKNKNRKFREDKSVLEKAKKLKPLELDGKGEAEIKAIAARTITEKIPDVKEILDELATFKRSLHDPNDVKFIETAVRQCKSALVMMERLKTQAEVEKLYSRTMDRVLV